MVKSKYLILNSFYFNFDDNLTEIKKVKESFKKQTMLDLSRFDELKYIIHFTFEKLKNINFVYLPKNIEIIGNCVFYNNQIEILDLSTCFFNSTNLAAF